MMHSQAVMDKGEKRVCAHCKAEKSCCSVSHLQIKETRLHTRKCYHDELTVCDGQRRNESVHQFKAEKSWCGVSYLQIKETRCVHEEILS